ncbi:Na+/H+ antiporter [Rhizobium anhuiense]|jgi:CPA1 family monovalent cation:H+ antiporter|uniref:Na+/H+ antiporter n=1 Tax=Rhizobium anhuiense TaxID=1184720 RepID=A0A3S0QGH7_9HYPH|nr:MULTISPECIES: Na+/H+ antiporter [Rhizobium]KZS52547.1 Na+/H+ antiporter [Rhizobium anhuiense bv. trifolii]MBB3741356.1 CPA1 family monovalent cation:H+ antiporter [Rhizobium sp. BK591]MBB4110936.1 CPA1 family monovalent cation:H+ antiporter [Rhizobium sp. BK226]NKM56603.1 Na+/H+ antiporter [Rhizobium anhuiense]PDS39478.1 Na+/H+ antiporter [Rhizobium anhuiense]
MEPTHLFELVIVMFLAIIALHYAAHRLGLPPSVALLTGGALLAFAPGLPAISVDPGLVLVIFLPPLLMDGAWSIALARLRRHVIGIASLAVGAVLFTCAVVAVVAHLLFPSLPWAACAALGAIVAPPDAVSARAVLERVRLPRRLQILLEGESLLNDASGLVLFRFAVAAAATGAFSTGEVIGNFFVLALGGAIVGIVVGTAWFKLVRRLGDEYLIIAASVLLGWIAYLLGEQLHVSGVIATVTAGLIMSWHQHTVLSAAMRMRGTSFWTVMIFLMEAAVFILIGLSLRDVVERGGGFTTVIATMGLPMLAILVTLVIARFAWVFASDFVLRFCAVLGFTRARPLGAGGATVLSWAGVRGVVTLALALSLPEGFAGRDFILVTSFAVILGTVLIQGTTLGRVIAWARLVEPDSERARLTMSQAEAAMAQAQFGTVQSLAYDAEGKLIHPQLLERYQRRATSIVDYAERTEHYIPVLHAHFDVILEAVATGRRELIRLHRAGEIDDETLRELERDLDLEELSAISAKA